MPLISNQDLKFINVQLETLCNLLTDRISDLHEVKMMQAERHCFVLYRKELREIQNKLNSSLINESKE